MLDESEVVTPEAEVSTESAPEVAPETPATEEAPAT